MQLQERPGYHHRHGGLDGQHQLRAGGQRLCRRRGDPVAAGRDAASSTLPRSRNTSPARWRTTAASMSCPPSPGSARPTGICTPVGAILGTDPRHQPQTTSSGPRWNPSPTRPRTCSRRHGGRTPAISISSLRVDGGASANNFLMQFQSDIIGCPVTRPRSARDPPPWAPPIWQAWLWDSGAAWMSCGRMSRSTAPLSPLWTMKPAAGCCMAGKRQFPAPSPGRTDPRHTDRRRIWFAVCFISKRAGFCPGSGKGTLFSDLE